MTILFFISAAVTVFLLAAALILMFSGEDSVDARLLEVAASQSISSPDILDVPRSGLARGAAGITRQLKPLKDLIFSSDGDVAYRLTLAGFRKAGHVEIFTAIKLLLPVVGVIAGTFFGNNMITGIMAGAVVGYFGPDLVLTSLITRRQESVRRALPDALDLLVICMEAGLGIDQAIMRIGEDVGMISPALAEEFQIISREQRAGKPRLDAWRSLAERTNDEFVRQFVSMLVQTERFGTPIAHALGQFADMLRTQRTQAAEEIAAKAGVKLLFPLVLFIFPSLLLVTIGPAMLSLRKILLEL
jgi:tight adherence protein C